jgi:hypothetical protein
MANQFLNRKIWVSFAVFGAMLLMLRLSAAPQSVSTTAGLTLNSTNGRLLTSAANNDLAGTITIAVTSSSNSHSFTTPNYGSAPVCASTPISVPTSSGVQQTYVTTTTSAVTVHTNVSVTTNPLTFNYICVGNPD